MLDLKYNLCRMLLWCNGIAQESTELLISVRIRGEAPSSAILITIRTIRCNLVSSQIRRYVEVLELVDMAVPKTAAE